MSDAILEYSLTEVAAGIRKKEFSSEEVTRNCLEKIEELQPILQEKSRICNESKEKIAKDTEVAEAMEKKVAKEAKIVAKEAAAAKQMADDANAKVEESQKVLNQALK